MPRKGLPRISRRRNPDPACTQGLRVAPQGQRLGCIQRRSTDHFDVQQPVQDVQRMGFARQPLGQRQVHCGHHGLLAVMKNQRDDTR
jgi:hypothetical protein